MHFLAREAPLFAIIGKDSTFSSKASKPICNLGSFPARQDPHLEAEAAAPPRLAPVT